MTNADSLMQIPGFGEPGDIIVGAGAIARAEGVKVSAIYQRLARGQQLFGTFRRGKTICQSQAARRRAIAERIASASS